MAIQNAFWNFMFDKKYELYYYQLCLDKNTNINRTIKIIIAIISCSSFCSFILSNGLQTLWLVFATVGSVLNLITDLHPFQKRMKALYATMIECSHIYNDIERNWFSVANGDKTEEEINSLIFDYKEKWDSVENKSFFNESFPIDKKINTIANNEAIEYFKKYTEGETQSA